MGAPDPEKAILISLREELTVARISVHMFTI